MNGVGLPRSSSSGAGVPGLSWASDDSPGIRRVRKGRGFAYYNPDGVLVRDAELLARIRGLAIPPAWGEVWISPDETGHIQATGRDARGRKQYIYHPLWRQIRDETKFDRMLEFGRRARPRIREAVDRDLRRHAISRERVTAAVVSILDQTAIRIGNEQYTRENGTFGLTTLQRKDASGSRSTLRLSFNGKNGRPHDIAVSSPRVARVVASCNDLPGQQLFRYMDERGAVHSVTSSDVNAYLKEASSGDFTAKDFRTWTASTLAAGILATQAPPETHTEERRVLKEMFVEVSGRLGNTPAVCRKCYVHPLIIQAYRSGELQRGWARGRRAWERGEGDAAERLFLWLLAHHD